MSCLFCNIVQGTIPASIVYEDTELLAFHDVAPQAPTHILIIPKKHIATLNDSQTNDVPLLGQMVSTAKHIAATQGLSDKGYRLVFNVNKQAGQTVFHIHLHLLGGRQLTWPPG